MNIGVSGASGKLGQAVLRELAARGQGHKVVAISRTPEKAGAGVEARVGDYDRPDTLAQAYAGLDRLLLIPSTANRPGQRGQQNVAAITAAVQAGVKHIVFMSAAGTREQQEPNIGASYWVGEQHLIKTAPRWTILRMNYYVEALAMEAGMAAQSGALVGLAENRVAFVARDDVAAAAAGILLGEQPCRRDLQRHGAESLQRCGTCRRHVGGYGQAGRLHRRSAEALRSGMAQMGLPTEVVDTVISIQNDFAAGAFNIVTGDVEKLSSRAAQAVARGARGSAQS